MFFVIQTPGAHPLHFSPPLSAQEWTLLSHELLRQLPGHFDDGILPTPHFSARLPSLSPLKRSGSFPMRSGPSPQASSTPVVRSSPSTLGANPLSFSSLPSPQFSHLLFIHLLSSRLFLFLPPPPYHPYLRFLRYFNLFFFTFVRSHNILCLVLS